MSERDPRITWRVKLWLFWVNYFKRPVKNVRLWWLWEREGRPTKIRFAIGKFDEETYLWALDQAPLIEAARAKEGGPTGKTYAEFRAKYRPLSPKEK
jgi:hypothetical protein